MSPDAPKQPVALVVDNDEVTRVLAVDLLEGQGFAVEQATHGTSALELAARCAPDLVLLGICVPGIDAYEVCARLRALPQAKHAVILMLTSIDDTASIDRAYEVGATDFATKPINWHLLGYRLRYLLRASDVTRQLRDSEHRLARAQDLAQLGYWTLEPSSRRIRFSDVFASILGLGSAREAPLRAILGAVPEEDRRDLLQLAEAAMTGSGPGQGYARFVRANGSVRHVYVEMLPVLSEEGELVAIEGVLQDVSKQREAEARARYLAEHDGLTGLGNRRLFMERLRRFVTRENSRLAVLHVDVDAFRRINETLGGHKGDQLLRQIAQRLVDSVRVGDAVARVSGSIDGSVARIGADEFMVLLADVTSHQVPARVARRLLEDVSRPVSIEGRELIVTASIGIGVWPDDATDVESLVNNAQAATSFAKRAARGTYKFYTPSMNAAAERRFAVETRLRRAIERDELDVCYQPEVQLANGRICAAEALSRWTDAELGVVSPVEFIPVAEEAGLINALGLACLRSACEAARHWIDCDLEVREVSVNVSIRQLVDSTFVRVVEEVLSSARLPAAHLQLEVTESVLSQDPEGVAAVLAQIRRLGVRVAIDDFGTGYSSLAYLREMPVDVLKFDRAFVKDLGRQRQAGDLAAAIISMGRALGLRTVAEGVETREQLELLRAFGCDFIQGHLVSPACPLEEFEALARSYSLE